MSKTIHIMCIALLLSGCEQKKKTLFSVLDVEKAGLDFSNTLYESDSLNIQTYLYFYNGGGVAVGDVDNDGLPDMFFSGNQVKNKLYRNKGNLQFEDITDSAGVSGKSSWNTGAVMADINGDGRLDIYVMAVTGVNGFSGHNELFINNGNGSFSERSKAFGLDLQGYGTSAAFFDYDHDGDLDLYLLNHAIHTQESLDHVDARLKRHPYSGDRLMRNDGSRFTDVSEKAGIYGGPNGYGLGVAVSDFNNDGWPDLYISNDFQEDDYYYLNDQKGGFTEQGRQAFGQFSRFSMGSDVADINQDGWPDLLTLDMLPEDEKVLKASESDYDIQTELLRTKEYGYHYQFSRNMLHLNQNGNNFSEIALMGGVAATDWSWCPLFADYDQDGIQDLFVSNGIIKRPNDLDYINYLSTLHFRKKSENGDVLNRAGLDQMPSGLVPNKMYKGRGALLFVDKAIDWINDRPTATGATAYGDLDNDGDLDLVANTINGPPILYINGTDTDYNFLKIKLRYKNGNPFGIGAKVISYHNGNQQYREMYSARGFQSSSEHIVHFGYGTNTMVDSLKVIWPNGSFQTMQNVTVNQSLIISPNNARYFDYTSEKPENKSLFQKINDTLGLDERPGTKDYSEFNRFRLLPYTLQDQHAKVTLGDLDNNGIDELIFQDSGNIYFQKDSIFVKKNLSEMLGWNFQGTLKGIIVKDFNQDKKNDIILITAKDGETDQGTYFASEGTSFNKLLLPAGFENVGLLLPVDIDSDGDMDLFVGNRSVVGNFGELPSSYILKNDKGRFYQDAENNLGKLGMVRDVVSDDFDGDGDSDLIVVGEWMFPKFLKNTNGRYIESDLGLKDTRGLWQKIQPFDIDNDGDTDYLLGNWGLNSKFRASPKFPMRMYHSDFDKNGATETLIAIEKNGNYYPLETFEELSDQMVGLHRKFNDYQSVAGKTIEEIIGKETINSAQLATVDTLASGYLRNNNGTFDFIAFERELQTAPITQFLKFDFDGNGKEEVLAAGNFFGLKPFHGRLGAFSGAMIFHNGIVPADDIGLCLSGIEVRTLNIIELHENSYLIVSNSNHPIEIFRLPKRIK